MSTNPSAVTGGGQSLQATTGAAGFALQNATPNIISWTAPNDGNQHRFQLMGARTVTVAETGGAMTVSWTAPGGGGAVTTTVAGGTSGVGAGSLGNTATINGVMAPGTAVTLAQSTALTAGACQVNAEIWGS